VAGLAESSPACGEQAEFDCRCAGVGQILNRPIRGTFGAGWMAIAAFAVPVSAMAVRPVRFAIALLGGWLAADVVFLVYHCLYYLGYQRDNGVVISSVPLIVFTLAVVAVVAAALYARGAPSPDAEEQA
jgi:hypothetical protein